MKSELLNSFWIALNYVNKLLSGILFFSVLTKFLNTSQFGTFTYVLSIFSLFATISTLGLNQYVFIKISTNRYNTKDIIRKSIYLQFLVALAILVLLAFGYCYIGDHEIFLLLIISFSLLLKPSELFKILLDSNLHSKKYFKYDLLISIMFVIVKLAAVYYSIHPLEMIFLLYVVEALVSGVVYYSLSIRFAPKENPKLETKSYTSILKDTFPILIASGVFIIYSRVDQYMIYNMLGSEEQAYYSAALKLSEGWYFVFSALITSFFSTISKQYGVDKVSYINSITRLSTYCNILCYLAILFVIAFGDSVIELIFGSDYAASSDILKITIFQSLIISSSYITYRILLLEGLQRISLYRAVTGLFINIVLNYFLIYKMGIIGAALATLVSHFIALFLSNAFFKQTRYIFIQQLRSLFFLDAGTVFRK